MRSRLRNRISCSSRCHTSPRIGTYTFIKRQNNPRMIPIQSELAGVADSTEHDRIYLCPNVHLEKTPFFSRGSYANCVLRQRPQRGECGPGRLGGRILKIILDHLFRDTCNPDSNSHTAPALDLVSASADFRRTSWNIT